VLGLRDRCLFHCCVFFFYVIYLLQNGNIYLTSAPALGKGHISRLVQSQEGAYHHWHWWFFSGADFQLIFNTTMALSWCHLSSALYLVIWTCSNVQMTHHCSHPVCILSPSGVGLCFAKEAFIIVSKLSSPFSNNSQKIIGISLKSSIVSFKSLLSYIIKMPNFLQIWW
jgi:hypothetical protein